MNENKVDEDGNPILETETVAVPKKQYDEMVEKLADSTQSKANLVSEIKELREKKQLSDAEAVELRKKLEARSAPLNPSDLTPEKIAEMTTETVSRILSERETQVSKDNMGTALGSFKAQHPEFHPENDEGGIKMAMLERKLGQFNMSGLKTEKEFLSVLSDARRLVTNVPEPEGKGDNPNPLPPNSGGDGSKLREVSVTLTPKEWKIIENTFGGDKERYLKIKAKHPDYVNTLLQYSV